MGYYDELTFGKTHRRAPLLTSAPVLEAEIELLADFVSEQDFWYIPTKGERKALEYIGDRYAVTEELLQSMDSVGRIRISPFEVGLALGEDGVDRVPMLSDDTALQRIVWAIGPME